MGKSHYIIPIFVPHYGCPYNCIFCNQNVITGKRENISKESMINSAYVENTIEKYLNTIPLEASIIEVSFYGGTFTAIDENIQKELLAVARKYKLSKKINFIRLSTRPDYINEHILQYLKDYMVDIIEIGVQSMDEEVLKKSGRGHSSLDVINASLLINKYGFTLGHQLMLGLPSDTLEKDIFTTKEIIKLKPELCRIYPAVIVKGTVMEGMYNSREYIPYSIEEAVDISKKVYMLLIFNKVNVIRIGLQPTEEVKLGGDILAGPFHPAFRELVEGSIFNEVTSKVIKGYFPEDSTIEICINKKDLSKLYAKGKYYFHKAFNRSNLIKVTQDDSIDKGTISIKDKSNILNIQIYNYYIDNLL